MPHGSKCPLVENVIAGIRRRIGVNDAIKHVLDAFHEEMQCSSIVRALLSERRRIGWRRQVDVHRSQCRPQTVKSKMIVVVTNDNVVISDGVRITTGMRAN